MKLNFFLFSKLYPTFKRSQLKFHLIFIGGMRISMSILIALYIIFVFGFQIPTPLRNYVMSLSLFLINFVLSSLVLREKYHSYASTFMTLMFLGATIVMFEVSRDLEKGDFNLGIILGLKVGLVFTIMLLSKLPFLNFLVSIPATFVYVFLRSSRENFYPYNGISDFVLVIALITLYYQQQSLDFKTWCILKRSHEHLEQFKQLITIFPNQIIVIDKESLSNNRPSYLNEEARKIVGNLDLRQFLGSFTLEETLKEGGDRRKIAYNCSRSLSDIIDKRINREKSAVFDDFLAYQAIYKPQEPEEIQKEGFDEKDELFSSSLKNSSFKEPTGKFEIKIGFIEWGANDEQALILLLNDISKAEKIRELRILDNNKDFLLDSFSHGLKTPLNGVMGMIDTSLERTQDKMVAECLSLAKISATSLSLMINDILDFSLIQKRCLRLKSEAVNVRAVVESVIPIVELEIKKKGLILKYRNECNPNTLVRGDEIRLQQILLNFLTNSCNFTDSGYIEIEVYSNKPQEEEETFISQSNVPENENIVIRVTDTGRGIKEEFFPELFIQFATFKRDSNEVRRGMGLTISQSIAKMMTEKGIEFKSEIGHGSAFWITLKRAFDLNEFAEENCLENKIINSTKPMKIYKARTSQEPAQPKKRILIVDDDQINHVVAENYLKALGAFHLIKAFDGAQALKNVLRSAENKEFFDLVLMDINMPVMNGYQAAEEIVKLVKKGVIPQMKIIAITANVSAEDRQLCISKGMNEVLPKPINKADFQKAVRNALQIA